MHRINIYSLPVLDSTKKFAYEKHLDLTKYQLIYHSKMQLVNLTHLSEQIDAVLGTRYEVRKYLNGASLRPLEDYIKKTKPDTIAVAIDEGGDYWVYKTIAVDFIVTRDVSAKAEVYERIFAEAMIDIPDEASNQYLKLATMVAGLPEATNFLDVPEEAKLLGYMADNMLKDSMGIDRMRADDLGRAFYTKRIEVMKMLQNMVASGLTDTKVLETMISVVIARQ